MVSPVVTEVLVRLHQAAHCDVPGGSAAAGSHGGGRAQVYTQPYGNHTFYDLVTGSLVG